MNEDATSTTNMKGCTLIIDCTGYTSKRGKRENKNKRKEKKRKEHERKKYPWKDSNL